MVDNTGDLDELLKSYLPTSNFYKIFFLIGATSRQGNWFILSVLQLLNVMLSSAEIDVKFDLFCFF